MEDEKNCVLLHWRAFVFEPFQLSEELLPYVLSEYHGVPNLVWVVHELCRKNRFHGKWHHLYLHGRI